VYLISGGLFVTIGYPSAFYAVPEALPEIGEEGMEDSHPCRQKQELIGL
jgi:hypothetical protein